MGMNDLKFLETVQRTATSTEERRRMKVTDKIDRYLDVLSKEPLKLPARNRWIFKQPDGTFQLAIMYGSKALEVAKGRHGIACASVAQLISALKVVKQTVSEGKLDQQIELAAEAIRSGFKKN
ncbi:hypothetical protein IHQ71_28390 [Rhizobium sp. TH2]|uniref:hypothetical protein n=1 Tax=Rhizobium sp. TH2 TaxID=2775403 RepID=UPI00215713D6|nr:hypothetical protein [Rhizobium sp. TH2]UVC08984.1 hypothetical protein IHQ71_28390 [Rhizobium sp. TH2]